MQLSYVPLFGLLLLGGPADPASARSLFSAVPSDAGVHVATSRVPLISDPKALTAERSFPQARTPSKNWVFDMAAMAADNTEGQAASETKGPGSDDASRGWLGARVQDITQEIAVGLGMKATAGALVASGYPIVPLHMPA